MRERILRAAACAISISVAGVSASSAQTALSPTPPLPTHTNAEWAKDVTVLAIAPDGTWGVATEPFVHQAFAKAIAHCESKYRHQIGCGYRTTSIRAGWILVMRCGGENIVASAKTLPLTEQAAIDS